MHLETLETLTNDQLKAVIARSDELLKERDRKRKEETIRDVLAKLAAAGLTPADVLAKKVAKAARARGFKPKSGHMYRHPAKPELQCLGTGKKPKWWHELQKEGKEPVDLGPVEPM